MKSSTSSDPELHNRGVIRFGVFEVDLKSGELWKNGMKVRLTGQPFQVLAMLLARPGEVVAREEIRNRLWAADTFVDFDHSLNTAINKIREALDDSAESPRFVETLPRIGYRFIAPVIVKGLVGAGPSAPVALEVMDRKRTGRASRRPVWYGVAVLAGVIVLAGLAVAWYVRRQARARPVPRERQITANPLEDPIVTSAISPDGEYIAYRDQSRLYVRSIASGDTRGVSLPKGFSNRIFNLRWFPDGGKLLAVVDNPRPRALWVIPVLGEAQPRLLYQNAVMPAFSPDGQSVAFVNCCKVARWLRAILVGGMSGDAPRELVSVPPDQLLASPAWSPDGRWIAYARIWKNSDRSVIEVRPASGGPAKVVVSEASLPKGAFPCLDPNVGGCMAWSPRGRLLFAAGQNPISTSAPVKYSLWGVPLDSRTVEPRGRPRQVTQWEHFFPMDLAITPDGKRLSFQKRRDWMDVYLAELGPGGASVRPSRRLTLDDRGLDSLDSWTPDSRAILFSSSRNGRTEIFRKGLNEAVSQAIVRGPENYRWARRTADGAWLLYAEWVATPLGTPPLPDRIMRRPIGGGPPELVLKQPGGDVQGSDVWDYKCPQRPASPCVLSEKNGNDVTFYSFDPVHGKEKRLGKVVARLNFGLDWDVSPDGSRLALIGRANHEGRIEVLTFADGTWHEIVPQLPIGLLGYVAWAADGKAFFVTTFYNASLHGFQVTLAGRVQPLLGKDGYRVGEALRLLPSPDGKYLAYEAMTRDSNVWLLENF